MKTAVIKIKKDITLRKMIKRGLKEDMINFLQTPNKLFNNKRKQINKSKQKTSIGEAILRTTINSNLDSANKKELLVLILAIKKIKSQS